MIYCFKCLNALQTKIEVSTKEASNLIAQTLKKGKLRDFHGLIFWNYGGPSQTWADPNIMHLVVLSCGFVFGVHNGVLDWKVFANGSD
eukprot:gene8463-17442_t